MLTEVELELMSYVWRLKEATVNDIIASLPEDRKLAYTSISTILRILEQKNVLDSRKEGRGHVYFAKLQKDKYETDLLQSLVTKVFDGAPLSLARRLIQESDMTEADIKELRTILNERLR